MEVARKTTYCLREDMRDFWICLSAASQIPSKSTSLLKIFISDCEAITANDHKPNVECENDRSFEPNTFRRLLLLSDGASRQLRRFGQGKWLLCIQVPSTSTCHLQPVGCEYVPTDDRLERTIQMGLGMRRSVNDRKLMNVIYHRFVVRRKQYFLFFSIIIMFTSIGSCWAN